MKAVHTFVATRSLAQVHAHGAIICAVLAALMVGIAIPAVARRAERQGLRNAVDAADMRLQRTHAQVEETRREMARTRAKLEALTLDQPALALFDRRLVDVSAIAADCGLLVDAVEPGSPAKRSDGQTFTSISLSGRGPYPNIVAYVHQLRTAAPDLTVETAQLSKSADGGCVFRLSLNWWSPPANASRPLPSVAAGSVQ